MGFNKSEERLALNYRIVPKIVPILNDNLWYYVSFGDIRIRRSLGEKAN